MGKAMKRLAGLVAVAVPVALLAPGLARASEGDVNNANRAGYLVTSASGFTNATHTATLPNPADFTNVSSIAVESCFNPNTGDSGWRICGGAIATPTVGVWNGFFKIWDAGTLVCGPDCGGGNVTFSTGDQIATSISYSGGNVSAVVKDNTSGATFTSENYAIAKGDFTTALTGVDFEDATCAPELTTVTHFTGVKFTNASGDTGPVDSSDWNYAAQYQTQGGTGSGETYDEPTSLTDSGGTSAYYMQEPTPPPPGCAQPGGRA
jgi:hypothetical protein